MSKEENPYKFDKTVFKAMSFDEADNHYWKDQTLKERWNAGCYLSMQMYGCDKQTPINKAVFHKRKHSNH